MFPLSLPLLRLLTKRQVDKSKREACKECSRERQDFRITKLMIKDVEGTKCIKNENGDIKGEGRGLKTLIDILYFET